MESSIKQWIIDNSVDPGDFAKCIGVTRPALYQYFHGRCAPSLIVAMKIKVITGLKFSEILDCSPGLVDDWKGWEKREPNKKVKRGKDSKEEDLL